MAKRCFSCFKTDDDLIKCQCIVRESFIFEAVAEKFESEKEMQRMGKKNLESMHRFENALIKLIAHNESFRCREVVAWKAIITNQMWDNNANSLRIHVYEQSQQCSSLKLSSEI